MIATINFVKFLTFSISPLDIFIRGTLMYWFLFLLFRFILRRDTSSAGISDILLLVLLGDAAQNAMIGQGHTVADGMLLILTLGGWSYLLNYLSSRWHLFEKLTDPPAIVLITDGRLDWHSLRRQHLTKDEIISALRMHGLESTGGVHRMYMEGDGSFSVIKASSSSSGDDSGARDSGKKLP